MSDAIVLPQQSHSEPPPAPEGASGGLSQRVTELKVSGHLMTLESGLFCIVQTPHGLASGDGTGLPGVRISLPPGPAGRPDAVTISSFRNDGWLAGPEDAALVRVSNGPAQILVTIYQLPSHGTETAPRLQVLRLTQSEQVAEIGVADAAEAAGAQTVTGHEGDAPGLVAHVARAGDLTARVGDWIGIRGSKQWIEGFGVAPGSGIEPEDIEYQAVLGRGWLSPWVAGGQFCGSRGMALPVLGLRMRLRGAAATTHECSYRATFVDGSAVGPVTGGEACEADSLAPLEAFQLELHPKQQAARSAKPARRSR